MNSTSHPAARRAPLGEATRRVNNSQHQTQHDQKPQPIPHHESRAGHQNRRSNNVQHLRVPAQYAPDTFSAVNPRLSAIANEDPSSNRNSQISTTSTNSERSMKKCIGPWKLGKTLGKGATARVRLARHVITGQEAAVKIVLKKDAYLSQAGSLADLDRADLRRPDPEDGLRKMPVGIEREVAIMKLIQHPHIMELYDIWENRTEIYLVLEYIENGELFDYITSSRGGRLHEQEALRCFRQILSAVGYCHSFRICHRDLKPENILLTKTGQIKVADFGMAALHQSADHKLQTSCGSPHYAAPELLRGVAYKGDMVDVWSMGVILYAALAGRLPFDVEGTHDNQADLGRLVGKIKKGQYDLAVGLSTEAKSLISKMLQVNPNHRITVSKMWKHPLLRKYDYLDNFGGGRFPQSPSLRQHDRLVFKRSEISKDLVRNLRSLWHTLSEQQLMDALLSNGPNEQKLFYSLLVKYQQAQLENYIPDIEYSASDYHHTNPRHLTKTYSTRQFQPAKSKGHGRQMSKFTVISNGAETERSYDPFKASRPQHLDGHRDDRAFVTVHRPEKSMKLPNTSLKPAQRPMSSDQNKQRLAPPKMFGSRASMASSTRSRNSNPYSRAGLSYKRGVSFVHMRRHSLDSQPTPTRNARHSNYTEVTDDGGETLRAVKSSNVASHYIRSKKSQGNRPRPVSSPAKSGRASLIWGEDVRQLSSSLAKDCDEAFNRTSMVPEAEIVSSTMKKTLLTKPVKNQLLAPKPLPRAPARTDSVEIELLQARKKVELRNQSGEGESPRYLDRMMSHFDDLIRPSSPAHDRRVTSAPVDTRQLSLGRPLPSIHETQYEDSPRRGLKTASLPVHERRRIAEGGGDYDLANESTSSTIRKKKSSWFKRSSKSEEDNGQVDDSWSSSHDLVQPPYERPGNPHLVTPPPGEAPKKRGFNLKGLFKKRNSQPDMMLSNLDAFDDNESMPDSMVGHRQIDNVRQIAPQRNWIAKLFNVKPQARYICFSISRRKARQEIAILLKDWKKFGIRDVQIDKERNIVFGRVAAQNYLQLREVAFASEVMTVIEHGKRSALSIARFMQEHGAASSFQKVVETLEEVLKCKGLLVVDERKKRMMIKTLNSA